MILQILRSTNYTDSLKVSKKYLLFIITGNKNLSCKHTNFKESFLESEIRLKSSNSNTRKSSNISNSQFRVLIPLLVEIKSGVKDQPSNSGSSIEVKKGS